MKWKCYYIKTCCVIQINKNCSNDGVSYGHSSQDVSIKRVLG